MPKEVEIPELGVIEFGDDMSWGQVETVLRENQKGIRDAMFHRRTRQMEQETLQQDPPTLSDRYVQTIRSIGKGAIRGVAALPKAVGEVAAAINRKVYDGGEPGTTRSGNPEDLATFRAGQALEAAAEEASPDVPGLEGSFWTTDVPAGIGQVGGAIITGGGLKSLVTKGAGALGVQQAGKLGAQVAGRSALTTMAAAEYDDAYQRSIDRGDDADTAALKAAGYTVLAGTVEAKLGVGRLMRRVGLSGNPIDEAQKLAARGLFKTAVRDAAAGFTEEAVQRAAQDLIVDGQLDVNGIVREGGAGAVVQALLGAAYNPARRQQARETLDWIRDRQGAGVTEQEALESGLTAETLGQLGIDVLPPADVSQVPGDDFALPGADAPPTTTEPGQPTEVSPAVTRELLEQHVSTVVAARPGMPKITVLGSISEAPEAVQQAAKQLPSDTLPNGFVVGGEVYLVADRMDNMTHASRVLWHESLGHVGMRAVLGDRVDGFLDGVAKRYRGKPQWNAVVVDYGLDEEQDSGAIAEEIVARIAEGGIPDPSLWQKVVAQVRRFARSLGWKGEVTDNDIRVQLRRAADRMRTARAPEDAGVSFSVPNRDAEYLAVVDAGDMEAAQKMVDYSAKLAGFSAVSGPSTGIRGVGPRIYVSSEEGQIADRSRTDRGQIADVSVDPGRVRSAAAVTYDGDGNVVPLSQRFGTAAKVRFSARRQHVRQLEASTDLSQEIKDRITNHLYSARTNASDAQFAAQLVQDMGLQRAEQVFRDDQQSMPASVRTMLGHAIIKAYGARERGARSTGHLDQANSLADQAAVFINDAVLPRSTEVAQALQAFRAFSYLTPAGLLASTRRVIDRARGNALAQWTKPVEEVANALRIAVDQTVSQMPKDAEVQSATQQAVDQTIAASPDVQAEIRQEAAQAFGGLQQVVLDHFTGKSDQPLSATLQKLEGGTEAQAKAKASKITQRWKAVVRGQQEAVRRRIQDQRTLWQQYMDSVAGAVASVVRQQTGVPGPKAALDEFSGRLAQTLRAHVVAGLPKRGPKVPALTDAQVIGEALKHPEKYREAWARTVEVVRERFKDQPAVLAQIEATLAKDPELATTSRVDRAIAKQLKGMKLRVGAIVRKHYLDVAGDERTLVDRLVQEAGVQGEAALQLAARIQSRFRALAATSRQRILKELMASQQARRVLKRPELVQQLIALSNVGALSNAQALEAVAAKLKLPSLSKEAAAELTRRADALQQMPEDSPQRHKATVDVLNFVARQKGMHWWELPMALWYANVLSGPVTHIINTSSNLMSLGGSITSVLARQPTGLPTAVRGMVSGFRRGAVEAREILHSGPGMRMTAKAEAQGPLELLQPGDFRGAGLVAQMKYVARVLAATDTLFYFPAREAQAGLMARAIAKREGLSGSRLQVRVRQLLGANPKSRQLAQARAATEGLTGNDYVRRVAQLMDAARNPEAAEQAHQFALRTTFNNEPYGLLGAIAEGISHVHRQTVVSRLVVPFVNVVANVTNESLNYSPVGFGRAAWAHWNLRRTGTGRLYGQDVTDVGVVHDAYAKASVGLLGVGALLALAAAGADEDDYWFGLSGQGPATADQRKALRETGWIPYSIRIGNKYVGYANSPLAVPLAIAGNYLDAVKYRKLHESDLLNRVAYAFGQAGHVITQQSFLDSLMQLFQALDQVSTTKAGDRAVDVVSRSLTSVVVPQALRQVDRIFDPTASQPVTVAERVVAQVPFVRRRLKPALNALGDPVELSPLSRVGSRSKGDEIWGVLAKQQAWPALPEQGLLTPEEHYDLVELRGSLLRQAIVAELGAIAGAPPQEARQRVASLSSAATSKAKARLGFDRLEELRALEAP